MNTSSKRSGVCSPFPSHSTAMLAASFPELGAQTSAAPGPVPRIGLALSGGGARGIAHVGVLKVLDEMRIPISCVTGTSMGSIVGGTYAAGRSPAEMEKLVLEADWDEIFPRPPAARRNRRAAQDRRLQDAVRAGIRRQGRRTGAAQGCHRRRVDQTYFRTLARRRSASPTSTSCRFRSARWRPTSRPAGGRARHGSLAQAMRASMSVPGAISPVEIDGRLWSTAESPTTCRSASPQALRRRHHRGQHLDAAAEARRDHLGAVGRRPADQLPGQGKRRASSSEPHPNDVLIAPDLGDISAATFDRSRTRSGSARRRHARWRTS